jgi:dTDP-glucose 4,6-dehydratase
VRALIYYNAFNNWGWLEGAGPETRSRLTIVAGDVRDPFGTRRAVEGREIVFHLAALIAIPYSYSAPAAYVETNVHGTLNVLEACRASGVEKLVHTSTSEVYARPAPRRIDEGHPLQPQSPYSAARSGPTSGAELLLSFDCRWR